MHNQPDHFILICQTCKGSLSAEAIHNEMSTCGLPANFFIRKISCMAGCKRPTTVGFQSQSKAQYLFGDIQNTKDIQALVEFAHQYSNISDGWTKASTRPRQLYSKTLSRMPCLELEQHRNESEKHKNASDDQGNKPQAYRTEPESLSAKPEAHI